MFRCIFFFGTIGKGNGVNEPCTDMFPGERRFSEAESSNIAAYLSKHKHKIAAFFDIHSYSKLWLSPWGWKNKKPSEYSSHMVSGLQNRPFSKMAAENSNKSKLKTYTSTRKNTFTLVTLQSFSISGVISAEKM